MSCVEHLSLRYSEQGLSLLDQTRLPLEECWIHPRTPEQMEEAIKKLKVRGAPMIGLSVNFFLAWWSKQKVSQQEVFKASVLLKASRPTAVNLIHYMNEFQGHLEQTQSLDWIEDWAIEKWNEDVAASKKMASLGVELLKGKTKFLTHCNTGGLAAANGGTALGVITALSKHNTIHVYVDETRPLLQGGRLTTWELSKQNVPYTLICDNMAASLMLQNRVEAVLVGADRIAKNGDTANKIGTYSLAVLAYYHEVPFYVVAPESTLDRCLKTGQEIPVEERASEEVQGWAHPLKKVQWAPRNSQTYNPAFDVTPANLISAWITEKGIFTQEQIVSEGF